MAFVSRTALFFLMLPAFLLSGFSTAEKPVRATWLWQTYQTASQPDQILSFTAKQGVNLLYLKIDTTLKPAYYQSFVKQAREMGIEVHALGGKASWGLERGREEIHSLISWVVRYNQSVGAEAAISGIHLDIEPHTLPEWKTDQASVIRQWMANVDAYTSYLQAQAPDLHLGADIPFWLDKYPLQDQPSISVAERLIAAHDHVAVMAYRDKAEGSNSISALVPQELEIAERLGKKIAVAVETKASSEGDFVTFYEEGRTRMEEELAKLHQLLGDSPSFAGVAIHSYEYWSSLKE